MMRKILRRQLRTQADLTAQEIKAPACFAEVFRAYRDQGILYWIKDDEVDAKQWFKLHFRPEGLSFRIQSVLSSKCIDGVAPGESGKTAVCSESPTQFWRLAL